MPTRDNAAFTFGGTDGSADISSNIPWTTTDALRGPSVAFGSSFSAVRSGDGCDGGGDDERSDGIPSVSTVPCSSSSSSSGIHYVVGDSTPHRAGIPLPGGIGDTVHASAAALPIAALERRRIVRGNEYFHNGIDRLGVDHWQAWTSHCSSM